MSSAFGLPELVLILGILLIAVLWVVPASRICAKAGYSPWLGVLALLPVANVVLALFLAFARWPIEKQLEALRRGVGSSN
jgi:hypothetical protein